MSRNCEGVGEPFTELHEVLIRVRLTLPAWAGRYSGVRMEPQSRSTTWCVLGSGALRLPVLAELVYRWAATPATSVTEG
jgi:hypothetical protein